MNEQTSILIISILLVINSLLIMIGFFSGIAKRVYKRIKQKLLYYKGNYVNTLFTHKTGVAEELFIKKNIDGSFTINNERYIINRQLTIILDGIPTQRNIEGKAEPIPWDTTELGSFMSTAELESVITNNENQNTLADMLKTYYPIVIIIIVLIVGLAIIGLYFNWQIYDVLVQQGLKATQIIAVK